MNAEVRAEYWECWEDQLGELLEDVYGKLRLEFAPHSWNDDAKSVRKLYRMLEGVLEYVSECRDKADAEVYSLYGGLSNREEAI